MYESQHRINTSKNMARYKQPPHPPCDFHVAFDVLVLLVLPNPHPRLCALAFFTKERVSVIGHGIVGKDIPIMARLAEARRWSKR
jgi:hypothetical protein